ncbi:hypothetical protein ACPUYX_19915 [Desulfosporosinus sp. SYSU MS00001]
MSGADLNIMSAMASFDCSRFNQQVGGIVFETKQVTMEQLLAALDTDF